MLAKLTLTKRSHDLNMASKTNHESKNKGLPTPRAELKCLGRNGQLLRFAGY